MGLSLKRSSFKKSKASWSHRRRMFGWMLVLRVSCGYHLWSKPKFMAFCFRRPCTRFILYFIQYDQALSNIILESWWYKDDNTTFPLMDGSDSINGKLTDLVSSLFNSSSEATLFYSTGELCFLISPTWDHFSVYGTKGDPGLRNAPPNKKFTCLCYNNNYDGFLLRIEISIAVIIVLILALAPFYCKKFCPLR